eukprot:352965-Chlamydomonas_euryale.AAC.39
MECLRGPPTWHLCIANSLELLHRPLRAALGHASSTSAHTKLALEGRLDSARAIAFLPAPSLPALPPPSPRLASSCVGWAVCCCTTAWLLPWLSTSARREAWREAASRPTAAGVAGPAGAARPDGARYARLESATRHRQSAMMPMIVREDGRRRGERALRPAMVIVCRRTRNEAAVAGGPVAGRRCARACGR